MAATQFLVGTYSTEGHKGLSLLRFDAATDSFTTVRAFAAVENASFALYDDKTGRLYVTDEIEKWGWVGAYELSRDFQTLKALGARPSEAGAPCFTFPQTPPSKKTVPGETTLQRIFLGAFSRATPLA